LDEEIADVLAHLEGGTVVAEEALDCHADLRPEK
jgi:hypothetical protein